MAQGSLSISIVVKEDCRRKIFLLYAEKRGKKKKKKVQQWQGVSMELRQCYMYPSQEYKTLRNYIAQKKYILGKTIVLFFLEEVTGNSLSKSLFLKIFECCSRIRNTDIIKLDQTCGSPRLHFQDYKITSSSKLIKLT